METGVNDKHKILIGDNEISNIMILSLILKPHYTVLTVKDGLSAIEAARNSRPDLILLDVAIPGLNAFDTLVKLKDSDLTRDIPVIFFTGRDNAEEEAKALTLGAVDYIARPFHPSTVAARVRVHLQMVEYIRTIERLCRIDALTNIPNRRYFDEQMAIEWERAIRENLPVSMLMIDIDKFKAYNDTYGHTQGDTLLKSLSGIFRQTLKRPADFVSRWGGEEFAILLPNTGIDGAMEVAEHIRANVEEAVVTCADGQETRITVSIGVNSEHPCKGSSVDALIAGADKALYAAKDAGRNRILHNRHVK